jgi:predicted peroxiredoxin
MHKNVFVKFVSEPKNDQFKSMVGLACAAQAINDGHKVSVFFAAAGTRLLDPKYLQELGADMPMVASFMEIIAEKATLYCSFASVKAVLGHSEGDSALVISDDEIQWSGPPGVIALATSSDVQLTY